MLTRIERWWFALRARVRALRDRARGGPELDEELGAYYRQAVQRHVANGTPEPWAHRAARRDLGGVRQLRESCDDMRRVGAIEHVAQDVHVALRQLRRSPRFVAIAVATTAIGIGASTAVFSVVYGVVLKPLPFAQPDQLVAVRHDAPGLKLTGMVMAPSLYDAYRRHNRSLQDIGLWSSGTAAVTGLAQPEQVDTLLVTDGTLTLLGVAPALGRPFVRADGTEGSPDTVLVSHEYWQSRFGGNASVVGRTLMVNARPREIVGVLPRGFRLLDRQADVVLPLKFGSSQLVLGYFNYQGIARLKPGVSIGDANIDLAGVIPVWLRSYPAPPGFSPALLENAQVTPALRALREDVVGDIRPTLWVVLGTAGMVLLMACANVANLLLVRAESRWHELATRVALGAGRGRVVREQLAESVLLGLAGGGTGLVLAHGTIRMLRARATGHLPRLDEIGLDPVVVVVALALSLIAGVLFGLVPVLRTVLLDRSLTTHLGGRGLTATRERHRARSGLVVVQVALALVLLVCAGLIVRTFAALQDVQPGFTTPEEIQTFRLSIPEAAVPDRQAVVRMQQSITEAVRAVPGVTAVAFGEAVPLEHMDHDPMIAEGFDPQQQMTMVRAFNFVSPGLFEALGNPLRAGRDFTWVDAYEHRRVVIVSENYARELWGTPAAAIGKRLSDTETGPWREIVGVVGNASEDGVDRPAPATVYHPVLVDRYHGVDLLVRRNVTVAVRSPRAGTEALVRELEQAVWSVSPTLPVANVQTLRDSYDRSMARTTFTMIALAVAGATALLLGLIGIYAVLSASVAQRTPELGIRLALGARRGQVLALIHRHSVGLVMIGLGTGLIMARLVTPMLQSVLFGVTPLDPATFATVSVLLAGVATLAAHLPARRAANLDPLVALRRE